MALPVINSKADGRVTRARSQSREVSVEPPPTKQTKGKGRAQPARGAKKSKPLFIESDEEDAGGGSGLSAVQEDDDDFAAGFDSDDDDTATLPTTGRRTQKSQKSQATKASQAKGKKRNAVMLDDDSDDGYKGLGGYKKRR